MYIANIHFGDYRAGDEVPEDLPHNSDRLKRGLIREVKVVNPVETKAKKNVNKRKPKNATKSNK
jgi:hypothetical protein